MQKKGNKYGTHRVIEPKGVLPQPANKIDNNMDEIYDNEILIGFFYRHFGSCRWRPRKDKGDNVRHRGKTG